MLSGCSICEMLVMAAGIELGRSPIDVLAGYVAFCIIGICCDVAEIGFMIFSIER